MRFVTLRTVLVLVALLAWCAPVQVAAQDDPNDAPLGDVARSLRKKTPPAQGVIDDDNLSKALEQAESRHPVSAWKFLMAGEGKGFRVSAPDVTCSLAFTANVKSLLSANQYAQMELPSNDLPKLDGPATIEGNSLIVAVYNHTDWHLSEVAVAVTVVKKKALAAGALLPGMSDGSDEDPDSRSQKKSDTTVIYRMRAAGAPFSTTVFSAPLNLEVAPDEEWHWAIVQARGYPPQAYAGAAAPEVPQSDSTAVATPSQSTVAAPAPVTVPASDGPKVTPVSSPQNPQ